MLVIVDYGIGNVGSIKNMLRKAGAEAIISGAIDVIANAKSLVLPGVGAFDRAMDRLRSLNMVPILNKKALEDKIPILGICLGMQMLTDRSEEGTKPGLGWIRGETRRFKHASGSPLRIPHMGWNTAIPDQNSGLIANAVGDRFYFVHSYHVVCLDPNDVMAWTDYGYKFASAVRRDNIMGVQFHPEKSQHAGLRLLQNFAHFNVN